MVGLLQPHLERIDETFGRRERPRPDLGLTRREREILAWVEAGKTNSEIAQILWISPLSVRKHLENVYEKLDVRTRTAAVARVRERTATPDATAAPANAPLATTTTSSP